MATPQIPESSSDRSTIKSRYDELANERDPFLKRAQEAARLTIPSLVPPDGHRGTNNLPSPWQSIGSRGVNHLASKLLLTLLPPNQPFFRLDVDPFVLDEIVAGDDAKKADVDAAFARIESTVMSVVESEGYRTSGFEGLKQLIVSGNVLLYDAADAPGFRVFHMERYVVSRAPSGVVNEIITKEEVSPHDLLEQYQAEALQVAATNQTRTVELYTQIKRKPNGGWVATQEAAGGLLEEQDNYPKGQSPWRALRWTRIDGEDYGRGFIEEYIGDLNALEDLSKLLVEGTAQAAKVLWLVDPSSTTRAKDITDAHNGHAIPGREQDVGRLGLDKSADFSVAFSMMGSLNERLSAAFLLRRTRDAERVTAEEIRLDANELESSLGGVYSILAQEFQLPLVDRLMARLKKEKKLPELPVSVKPVIVTGVDALGRFHELSKINTFMQTIATFVGPEQAAQLVKSGSIAKTVAASLGLDITGWWKSEEELQQEQQQQQQLALAQTSAASQAVKAVADQASNAGGAAPPTE